VDDTSARHANQDEFTTQFGDDRFAVFRTGPTKSRRRFLYDLQCGREDFVIDEEALAYMRRLHLKTCAKLKVSYYHFLGDRFGVQAAPSVPRLADLVRLAAT
jgi:hypothetical protein